MSRLDEMDWQIGAFAFEADFIDSQQLCEALKIWTDRPDASLVQILVQREYLHDHDLPLLESLWMRKNMVSATELQASGRTLDASAIDTAVEQTHIEGAAAGPDNLPPCDTTDSMVQSRARFIVQKEIASGGLGRVFLATDTSTQRNVALKEMLPQLSSDPQARRRFTREAEITASLEHPAIVPIHYYGRNQAGLPFYCMRWIEGQTLREAALSLHQANQADLYRSIEFRRLIQSFLTVCQAVAHAHEKGIVHRDLKPSNILIGSRGETVIVDWGLAKRLDEDEFTAANVPHSLHQGVDSLTLDGSAIGTPAYMSPEVAAGQPATTASDIFSLGATLAYVLTGQSLYRAPTVSETLKLAQAYEFSLPASLSSAAVPLLAICRKCLMYAPADRYGSALALAVDIERYLADESVSVWTDDLATRTRRWLRRHPSQAATALVTAIAGVFCVVAFTLITSVANEKLSTAAQSERRAREQADADNNLARRSLQRVTYEIQRKLRYVPATQKVRQQMLQVAIEGLNELSTNMASREQSDHDSMIAHRDLGELYLEVGNIDDKHGLTNARIEFQHALTIATMLAQQSPASVEHQRQKAVCLQLLGRCESQAGATAGARKLQRQAFDLLNEIENSGQGNVETQRTLAVSHNLMGDLEVSSGSIEAAGQHYLEALAIHTAHEKMDVPPADLERDLIVAINKVGDYKMRVGQTAEAGDYFRRALEVSQRRARRLPGDYNAQRDLSTAHYNIARQLQAQGLIEQAMPYYRDSCAADEAKLALDGNNAQSQSDCLESNFNLAEALHFLKKDEEALSAIERAVGVGERLLAIDPSQRRATRILAYAYTTRGDINSLSNPQAALVDYQRCLALMTQVAAQDPTNPRGSSDIAFSLAKIGDCQLSMSEVDEAVENYRQALDLHRHRAVQHPSDVKIQQNVSAFAMRLGKALAKVGHHGEAREFLKESLTVAERLAVQAADNIRMQVLLIDAITALGDLESDLKQDEDAHELYNRALAVAVALKEKGRLNGEDATRIGDLKAKADRVLTTPRRPTP